MNDRHQQQEQMQDEGKPKQVMRGGGGSQGQDQASDEGLMAELDRAIASGELEMEETQESKRLLTPVMPPLFRQELLRHLPCPECNCRGCMTSCTAGCPWPDGHQGGTGWYNPNAENPRDSNSRQFN